MERRHMRRDQCNLIRCKRSYDNYSQLQAADRGWLTIGCGVRDKIDKRPMCDCAGTHKSASCQTRQRSSESSRTSCPVPPQDQAEAPTDWMAIRVCLHYYMTHSLCASTSRFLRSNTPATSGPHSSSGLLRLLSPTSTSTPPLLSASAPTMPKHSFICLSASADSITTQLSSASGSAGSQRTRVGRVGTGCGGMSDRPRCTSSKTREMSSSSIGSLLHRNDRVS